MLPVNSKHVSPCTNTSSSCVLWQGPDIPCIGICDGDTIDDVIGKLGEAFCDITVGGVSLVGLDLKCVIPQGQAQPSTVVDAFNSLASYICALPKVQPYTLPFLNLPSCLQYVDPSTGNTVTQSRLDTFLLLLSNEFCDLVSTVNNIVDVDLVAINSAISVLQNQVNALQNASNDFNVTSSCFYPSSQVLISTLVLDIESAFCNLRTATGTVSQINTAISNVCVNGNNSLLGSSGTYSGLTDWINSPNTLAGIVNNLWQVVCDMRTAISNINNTTQSSIGNDCDSMIFDFNVEFVKSNSSITNFKFNFSNSIIGGAFSDTNGSTTITITDTLGNSITGNADISGVYQNAGNIFTMGIGTLSPYAPYTVRVAFSVTDGTTTCSNTITEVIYNEPPCPDNLLIEPPATTSASVMFTTNLPSKAIYHIEAIDTSGAVVSSYIASGINSGVNMAPVLTGLTPASNYYIKFTVIIDNRVKVCLFDLIETIA